MVNDPIIEEIHRTREENARNHNFNPQAMAQDFMRRQVASGQSVVNLHKPATAPTSASLQSLL